MFLGQDLQERFCAVNRHRWRSHEVIVLHMVDAWPQNQHASAITQFERNLHRFNFQHRVGCSRA